MPGGSNCSGAAAGMRAWFYKSPSSTTLQPWAAGYRDLSALLTNIVRVAVPAALAPQVVIIDALKSCDATEALKRQADDLADSLRWRVALVTLVSPLIAIGWPPAAPFLPVAIALDGAMAGILEDYAAGRPIDGDRFIRALFALIDLMPADKIPPDARATLAEAKNNPAVQAAVAAAVTANPPPRSTVVDTGTLTSQETNCFRALIGASFAAVETSADVFALTDQMKVVSPCTRFVGPVGTEEQWRVLLEQGNAEAKQFFKSPSGLTMLVTKWKKALTTMVGSDKVRLFSTKQQVSDAWRAALAGKKLAEDVLTNTLGLLPLDPANRKVVKAGGGIPTFVKVIGGVVVVGGVIGGIYAVATSKKRKAA